MSKDQSIEKMEINVIDMHERCDFMQVEFTYTYKELQRRLQDVVDSLLQRGAIKDSIKFSIEIDYDAKEEKEFIPMVHYKI